MKTFYDILNINKDATPIEIKKAYFSMVRKYPPERFPSEFMEIRQAYETLSNEKLKSEYDQWAGMPSLVRKHFDIAKEAYEEGDNAYAIQILEELNKLYPKVLMVKSLLGEAYINNENPGKAIKVFENLISIDPKNPNFTANLAKAYLLRGWHKKALQCFKEAISLDEENFWLWYGLSEAYMAGGNTKGAKKVLQKLLTMDEAKENLTVSIYFRLFLIDLEEHDLESMEENLNQLSKIETITEEEKEGIAWVLYSITSKMMMMENFDLAKLIASKAVEIIPDDKELIDLKEEVDKVYEFDSEFSKLEDNKNYSDDFISFIYSQMFPMPMDEMDEREIMHARMGEYSFLMEFNINKKYIPKLKEDCPGFYGKLKDFFEKMRNPMEKAKRIKKLERYFDRNIKLMGEIMHHQMPANPFGFYDDDDEMPFLDYDDHEPQMPYVRAEEKISRNDPCPCGSGKKYKKCCGK